MTANLPAILSDKPYDPAGAYHVERTWRQVRQGPPPSPDPKPVKK